MLVCGVVKRLGQIFCQSPGQLQRDTINSQHLCNMPSGKGVGFLHQDAQGRVPSTSIAELHLSGARVRRRTDCLELWLAQLDDDTGTGPSSSCPMHMLASIQLDRWKAVCVDRC